MDTLKLVLFESPMRLGVLSFLLFAGVLLVRRRWVGRAARFSLPATLAAIVLLFILQGLVTTQREEILEAMDAFATAIAEKDTGALRRAIARSYRSEGMDRETIVGFIRSALKSVDIYDARLRRRDVRIEGDRADMVLGAMATVRVRGDVGAIHTSRWRIGWTREGTGWKITSIVPEMFDTMPIDSLIRLRSYAP